ncbi:type III PLP-dependent enzyme [Streptomyces polychromogenes]|uniref:Type III PLP-dependent enzyme n=1 Tax=Streptomyces polychromogenes TaxID=67342 RepID=A0ABN0V0A5_9ACTN
MSRPAGTPALPAVSPLSAVALLPGSVETPAYVYDLAEVRANADRLLTALPGNRDLYYSLKANPHPAVLRTLRAAGARPEVCSPGELEAALEAGWSAGTVLYTGPGKRDRDVAAALAAGVREFSVDSPTALDQLDRLCAEQGVRARCLVRVNDDQPVPGQALVMTGVPSPFGADADWIREEPALFANRPHTEIIGLHLYMGTNLGTVEALLAQFTRAAQTFRDLAQVLRGEGVELRVLDLGGGFGAPFATAGEPLDLTGLARPLAAMLDAELPGWRSDAPRLAFESGRYLVGTAGTLLTTVLDAKRSQGKEIVVLDCGINHLGGMSGLRRLPPLTPHLDTAARPAEAEAEAEAEGEETVETMVCGPLCTPLDTWDRRARLPRLVPGDRLTVPNVGAYGLYASLVAFLGHPLPVEAAVDTDRPGEAPVHLSRVALVRGSH